MRQSSRCGHTYCKKRLGALQHLGMVPRAGKRAAVRGAQAVGVVGDVGGVADAGGDVPVAHGAFAGAPRQRARGADLRKFVVQYLERQLTTAGMLERLE